MNTELKHSRLDITRISTKYISTIDMIYYFEKHQKTFISCLTLYADIERRIKSGEPTEHAIGKLVRKLIYCHTETEYDKFLKEFVPISDTDTCREFIDEWYFICKNSNDLFNLPIVRELNSILNKILNQEAIKCFFF